MSKLSVIVVNWNTAPDLARCLDSLAGAQEVDLASVIVVDNASTDDSLALLRGHFPPVRLVANSHNAGFARANNQALALADTPYVLLLNPDTVVHPNALTHLLNFLEEHPHAGACGPQLLNADESLQHGCHPMLTPGRELWRLLFLDGLWPRATYPLARWTRPHRVEVIKGAALLLRKAALDEVGPLDDGYFMYTEEVDLCRRLAHAGWELWYVPEASVTHYGGASTAQVAGEMYVQLYRSKVQFYRKFGGELQALRFKRYLRLAYWPRVGLTALAGVFKPAQRARSRFYRRFIAEIGAM